MSRTESEIGGINLPTSDFISVARPEVDTEVYTFRLGGSGGAIVGILTIVYTDATKADVLTVTLV